MLFIKAGVLCLGLLTVVGGFLSATDSWPSVGVVVLLGVLTIIAARDVFQLEDPIRRAYPVIAHCRYALIALRPLWQQYFLDNSRSQQFFSIDLMQLVRRRGMGLSDLVSFDSGIGEGQLKIEFITHALIPTAVQEPERLLIGEGLFAQPYSASLLNISALGYGPLSKEAILALNYAAWLGGFAQNTGEDGLTPYHLKRPADLIWQIGTGYFGCRTSKGRFDHVQFREKAGLPQVRLVELKLSQGAKPGYGAKLPGEKITREVAEVLNVPAGKDVVAPGYHTAFSNTDDLLLFVDALSKLSGGKPVGIKLCVGKRRDFLELCSSMERSRIRPAYICIDGSEGGTGAAPWEFVNGVGMPLSYALPFVCEALRTVEPEGQIRVMAAGRVASGLDMFRALAHGANLCCSARAMMIAMGCIQARRCHEGKCPVGIASHAWHKRGVISERIQGKQVARFHERTLKSLMELVAAAGLNSASDIREEHIARVAGRALVVAHSEPRLGDAGRAAKAVGLLSSRRS